MIVTVVVVWTGGCVGGAIDRGAKTDGPDPSASSHVDGGPRPDGGISQTDAGGDIQRDTGGGALTDAGGSSGQTDAGGGAQADGGGAQADGGGATGIWRPAPGTSWQWQLTGTIDTSVDVAMYDIDLFDTDASVIAQLHGAGRVVICYFSAGSYEDWRPDAAQFPATALGDELDGWPGERWLDVRNATVRSIMTARLDLAVSKGCDGVEPDNVDGYANDTGFPLTAADQLDYLEFLAQQAHDRGLSIGLKNDLDQVTQLVTYFDWALNEECFAYDECDLLAPFIQAGKAVFQVEYGSASLATTICPQAKPLQFDTLIKTLDLDAWRVACD